jgi:hypothetical protein
MKKPKCTLKAQSTRENTKNVMAKGQKSCCGFLWLIFKKCAASVPRRKIGGDFGRNFLSITL